jgi:protein transport protein SEC24
MQYIYPRFYSLHDMPDTAGMPDPATNTVVLPPSQNLSSERLVPYGLYLLDDGQTQFLWLGRDAVPELVADVFGAGGGDRTQVPQGKTTLPELDNDFSERVRAVLEKSRDHAAIGAGSIIVPPLYVVREDGDPALKLWAQTLLVEDRGDAGAALQQWLGLVREKVSAPAAAFGVESMWPD